MAGQRYVREWMKMRQGSGATAITTSASKRTKTKAPNISAAQAISRGVGTRVRLVARISPMASPSSARSTTRVATTVDTRGPWRAAT